MKPHAIALLSAALVLAIAVPLVLVGLLAHGVMAPTPVADRAGLAVAQPDLPLELFNSGVQASRSATRQDVERERGPVVAAADYRVTGPLTHQNLSVYFIHGPDQLAANNIITLQQAVSENLATVHEGAIAIHNRAHLPLFAHAGDIIKGGTQDRVVPYDVIVASQGRTSVSVLCVEQGRSFPRGDELSTAFQVASEQLPTRELKLAAYRRSQPEVWNNVSRMQASLSGNLRSSVQAPLSHTSLQLTIEHPRLQQAIQDYLATLLPAANGEDVIGFVAAINGDIQSADVYASSGLFRDVWPKMLRAHSIAALAQRGGAGQSPTLEAVQTFLVNAENGQVSRQIVNDRTEIIRFEADRSLLFETRDTAQSNLVVHRSYLSK